LRAKIIVEMFDSHWESVASL